MEEKTKEQPATNSLSPEELKGISARRPTTDEFRQQAGVQSVDKKGRSLGTHIPKPPPKKVKEVQTTPPIQRTPSQESTLAQYYWLNPEETSDYPQLVLESSPETTVLDLVDLGKRINQVVDRWLNQKEERKRLAEVLELSPLPYEVILNLEKVNQLLTLEGLATSLRQSLENLKSFYEQDLLSLLRISSEKRSKLEEKARKFLETPKSKNQETYLQKAQRILLGTKGLRATRLYHSLVKVKAKEEIPSFLSEETLRLASIVNYVKLLEVLEEEGIDFPRIKGEVQELLAKIPPHQEGSSELTEEEEKWFEKLNQLLAPIANKIRKKFPHDTAYLLSQILEHQQAICAGKAMTLTTIYRSLGLDARFTSVLVIEGSKFEGGHYICQINLPNGIILSIDANWPTLSNPSTGGLYSYSISASLLFPTGETLSPRQVKDFLNDLSRKDISIILKRGQFLKYKAIGTVHRLTSQYTKFYIYEYL